MTNEGDGMGWSMIGAERIMLERAGSTNKEAADLLATGQLAHGTVILAHEQTDGRGQRGRSWISGPGLDLTFSVAVFPQELKAAEHFGLAKMTALAVRDVVQPKVVNEVRIKWPNDVLVERRKIAGILIQNEVVGGMLHSAIIGIGLNVNSRELDEAYLPTTLRLETGTEHDRMALLDELCDALERRWQQLVARDPELHREYSSLLWAKGRWAQFERGADVITGRAMDVDEDGRLIVEAEDGSVAAYGLEQLRFSTH